MCRTAYVRLGQDIHRKEGPSCVPSIYGRRCVLLGGAPSSLHSADLLNAAEGNTTENIMQPTAVGPTRESAVLVSVSLCMCETPLLRPHTKYNVDLTNYQPCIST